MPISEERKAETRSRVLAVAAEEIRAQGPDNISVAGVMAKAQLTHGGFYAHFASKDDLIANAVPVMFDDTYRYFLEDTQGEANPAQAIATFVDRYLAESHRDQPARGCPMPTLSGELARYPASRAAFAAGTKRITQSLAKLIAQFQPEHATETAASVLAEMVGALAVARAMDAGLDSSAVLKASRASIRRRLDLPAPTRRTTNVSGARSGAPPKRKG